MSYLKGSLTLEQKEKRSLSAKIAWANPEIRNKRSKAIRESLAKPEVKERRGKARKELWETSEYREKQIKAVKVALAKPEVKERMHNNSSGPNNANWNDGSSYKPYCYKFNKELKAEIRRVFGNKCFLCPTKSGKRKLSIHHTDYNKNTICNGKKWPLIPLCVKCHGKTNFDRWYWFNLLINYWAINPDINLKMGGEIYAAL